MTLRLAMMGSTSQVATHSPALHSTIHGYSNDVSEGILTPRSAPVANTTGPRSSFISLVVHNDRTFDKGKDHKVDNSGDRSGNDAACAPREYTTVEALAACVLLQLANPEGRTLIDVATEGRCMQLQALNGEADSAEWITKQNEVLDDSGHGKSIDGTLIHRGDQVMPPQPDAFGQQPKSQSSANTIWNYKSELNKYLAPISKPFKCNHKDCYKNRAGFASKSNLTRHTRTVHGDNLKGKTYICTNGHCAKDNPPKRWPRADNFRAHLKAVHKIEQVSDKVLQHYSTSSESVADGEQFVAVDDNTENEKGEVETTENEKAGVEINEDKFGEYFNGLTQAEKLRFLAALPATMLQAALYQKGRKVECNICGKLFISSSELRKHSKRHEKPYGCTVYRCEKTFGSKDDWKRHENQQHTPPEVWVCEKNCREAFGSRDLFGLHLEDSHHEMSPPIKEAKLEDNRQNIYSASLFWCGFCRCIVPIVDTSDPQDVRFDHIDDHFMGRRDQPKRNISQWLHMENPPTEREVTTAKRSPSSQGNVRRRKLNAASDARPPKQLRSRIV